MVEEDTLKTTFICRDFVDLFEWVVMTFSLKMLVLLIKDYESIFFNDLLGVITEVYIDDIVMKPAILASHLVDLRLAFERMCQYSL